MLFKDICIVDKDFEVKHHMYVMTKGAHIVYVGDKDPASLDTVDTAGQEICDGDNKLLMPAFYNTHCHVPMTLLRGYGEGLPLQRWLNEKIFPFEAKFLPPEKYAGAALGSLELLKSGCVSISDMYFDLPEYGRALYEAGMKANLSNPLTNFNDEDSFFDNNSYRDSLHLLDWMKTMDDGRIKLDAAIHAEYSTREKAVREACEWACDNDLVLHIHISETESEHNECKARHNGMTPVQYFLSCGAFKSQVLAAHCVWLSDEDADIMAETGAFMSQNASSNLKLGSGMPNIVNFRKHDMNITIGTDGASSNNDLNMLEEVKLTAMIARGLNHDANAVVPKEVLYMATRGGALAQKRPDCGLIDEGMRADLIVIDLDRENMIPAYDILSNVVFACDSEDIVLTMCDGTVVMKDRLATLVDEERIRYNARKAFRTVLAKL